MVRGISILSKIALATMIGGVVPLISGSTPAVSPTVTPLHAHNKPQVFSKAYGIPVVPTPAVPDYLKTMPVEKPSVVSTSSRCPFEVRAIVAAQQGGEPFVVLEYKGESSVLKVGDSIKAKSTSYRLSRVKTDHLILRNDSKWGQRNVRCSL